MKSRRINRNLLTLGGKDLDNDFICTWLRGFETGLNKLDAKSRSNLLKHCARQCANTGVLESYLRLYRAVGGNHDAFYSRLSELGNVRGEVVVPGQEYRICFPECACDLHTAGGVNTPCLCECSRQSILYVAETVWKGYKLRVEQEGTVLSGDPECRFRILFEQ